MKLETKQKAAAAEIEAAKREALRAREDAESNVNALRNDNLRLQSALVDANDEKEALQKWRELNLDAMTNMGRRLESLAIEKAEAVDQLKSMAHRLQLLDREKHEYKEKVTQLTIVLADMTAQFQHRDRAGTGGSVGGLAASGAPAPAASPLTRAGSGGGPRTSGTGASLGIGPSPAVTATLSTTRATVAGGGMTEVPLASDGSGGAAIDESIYSASGMASPSGRVHAGTVDSFVRGGAVAGASTVLPSVIRGNELRPMGGGIPIVPGALSSGVGTPVRKGTGPPGVGGGAGPAGSGGAASSGTSGDAASAGGGSWFSSIFGAPTR